MASESVKTDGSGKSSNWAWVDKLDQKVDNLATNTEKLVSVGDKIGGVVSAIFGGKKESPAVAGHSFSIVDYLPILAVGGLMAYILK